MDFTKMSEEELIEYLEKHPVSAPDQKFETGADISVEDGKAVSTDRKTKERRVARSSKWLEEI